MKRISTLFLVLFALLSLPLAASAYDVEAANIAAFNAAADGQTVKLTLTNARVNGSLWGTFYVEDASGATAIKGVSLTLGTALNGYVVGTKSTVEVDYVNDPSQAVEYLLTADASQSSFTATTTELVGTPMTIADACTQANYGKLVSFSDVTIAQIGDGNNKQVKDAAGNSLRTRDLFEVLPEGYTWPMKASKITGVLLFYMNGWYVIPISEQAIETAGAQPLTVTFDFLNNNMSLPIGQAGTPAEQSAGDLGGKKVTLDGVTLKFVNSMTMPTRYYLNGSRGNQFQAIADGQMRVTAPSGYAVTSIVSNGNKSVNSSTGAITYQNNWEIVKGGGTISAANQETQTWTGNAESVLLNAKGASYVENFVVTLAAVNGETALLVNETPDTYTEVDGLAAYNDVANKTLVKLTLTNAVVTSGMVNTWGFYLQDANAGAHFYCTGLNYEIGDVLNGVIYVKKNVQNMGARICMTEKTDGEGISVTKNGSITAIEGTVDEINIAANKCRVVKLSHVAVKGTKETEATLTDAAGKTININNGKTNYFPYVIQESLANMDIADATVTGILYGSSATVNQIMPLAIETGGSGIAEVNAVNADNVQIYNLQGVRLNQLQKGINIVNGRKIVIK